MSVISITLLGKQEKAVVIKEDNYNGVIPEVIDLSNGKELELTISGQSIKDAKASPNTGDSDLLLNVASLNLGKSNKAYIDFDKSNNNFVVIIDIDALLQDSLMQNRPAQEYRLDVSRNFQGQVDEEKKVKLKLEKENQETKVKIEMKVNVPTSSLKTLEPTA